ncbi:MAG: hypothetical protein VX589_13300 [Myxococcota bacterium]|nr:hypothetical protein [Myxococcota bacterium]
MMRQHTILTMSLVLLSVMCPMACDDAPSAPDIVETWPEAMRIDGLQPIAILPKTKVIVDGSGFVSRALGTSRLRFDGVSTAENGANVDVNFGTLVDIDDSARIDLPSDDNFFSQLCPFGGGERFEGTVALEVASVKTNQVHRSPPLNISLVCHAVLEPILDEIVSGPIFLNSQVDLLGRNLLLGEAEGETVLVVSGCFELDDVGPPVNTQANNPCPGNQSIYVDEIRLPVRVKDRVNRRHGSVLVTPNVGGIRSGRLIDGRVRLLNITTATIQTTSMLKTWTFERRPSRLDGLSISSASFGSFVTFSGEGFIGGGRNELAEITLDGYFLQDQTSGPDARQPFTARLIPIFESGQALQYLINDEDDLGRQFDFRNDFGLISGEVTLRLARQDEEVRLPPQNVEFRIAPIRQIVHVIFTQGYRDALARFGLRAAEALISQRIIESAKAIYRGIGVEFRTEVPTDYRLYAEVEITGVDPNGIGLIGYDNTPGKDVNNLRLYDRIGGANAQTQADNFPGYGGIFVESYFGFSMNPPLGIEGNPGASPLFDEVFDILRPDRGGQAASAAEISMVMARTTGAGCPSLDDNRLDKISCAVFVLGNLLGGTMAHEVAHSLGLADPQGEGFHNPLNKPFHLMDSGFDRPFEERAHLVDASSEYFCQENFEYLQAILPTNEPDPLPGRTSCR